MPEYVKNISKKYLNYEKILEYKTAWTPKVGKKKKLKIKIITEQDVKDMRNVIRARTTIHDIVACNTFEYFVTLTVSPEATINRYDYDDCAKHISKWLNNHLTKYLLVPEKHKDGAYHFHLLADIPRSKLKRFKGNIFNIKSYKYGYSTAIPISTGSEAKIANYIRKYITKDLISTVGVGRRRYWASRNLARPEVTYNVVKPPNAVQVWETDQMHIYNVPRDKTQ